MTAQELFNQAYLGVLAQDGPSRLPSSSMCAYRGPEGRKCALGLIITDEEYSPAMEGWGAYRLDDRGLLPERLRPHLPLLARMQDAHDSYSDHTDDQFRQDFQQEMKEIADDFQLEVPETSVVSA